ncbi:hypothetical protein Ob7_07340 [Thermosipho africanus Ob7]|uniref:AAA family ATPase n=1 Tax=Thermosipho africanus TaxID=2421 RepID=UPI000E0B61DE|nr:hypothetical protein Ob7_07340 [Thermosipho africanus Ob7]
MVIKPTEKNKFQILKEGKKAKNLSQGEKTAIAFAYFIARLEDKDTDLCNAPRKIGQKLRNFCKT